MKNEHPYWLCDRFGVPVRISKKQFYNHWRFYKVTLGESKIIIHRFSDSVMVNLYHKGKQVLYYFTK